MDVLLFVKILAWIVAVGATIIASLSAFVIWGYHYTPGGNLKLAMMNLKGQQPVYRWRFLLIAMIAWVAIISFR